MPNAKAPKTDAPIQVIYDEKSHSYVDPLRVEQMLQQTPLGREALRRLEAKS